MTATVLPISREYDNGAKVNGHRNVVNGYDQTREKHNDHGSRGSARHLQGADTFLPGVAVSDDLAFALRSHTAEYRFHVDEETGDLVHDHFGLPARGLVPLAEIVQRAGWGTTPCTVRREFPDSGRGDFRLPAIHVRHRSNGNSTVTHFKYRSHEVLAGKPPLPGLPATFGTDAEVSTLVVHLHDEVTEVHARLHYSVFAKHNAIARSFSITNNSPDAVEIERAASFSIDMTAEDWDLIQLSGDWGKENHIDRRRIHSGSQGFQSLTGYSSHFHNPFFALAPPSATETTGFTYGFNLIYSGSFSVDVEKSPTGRVRSLIGLNPLHLSWPLAPGESFQSPEAVAVFSDAGLNGMSQNFHALYRQNLSRSKHVYVPRPALLNSWEAVYLDFDDKDLYALADSAADLNVKLFVLDDGWFGNKHPRITTEAGLGDWKPNKKRFPDGWEYFVRKVKCSGGQSMKFGLWVEPEMVNAQSDLFNTHPEWVLRSGSHEKTEKRNQLVLDLGLVEVQEYIIGFMTDLLSPKEIDYIKWDCNRGIHELPSPSSSHRYILGLYHVLDVLITRFPEVLFEGCASGGGRFDAGILYYWPQTWTSDNTDALDRLFIQFGTSLVYPLSSMGCHVSACPNDQVGRSTPFEFRAHVALMGGSFGFELDPAKLTKEERALIPHFVTLSEKVNPIILQGEFYRLAGPQESNWPAAFYMQHDGSAGFLLAYQIRTAIRTDPGPIRLRGLEMEAQYSVDGVIWSGSALMNAGFSIGWEKADYQSKMVWVEKLM